MMRRLLCVLALLFVAACDTDEDFNPTPPTGPSIPTIGGTYSSSTMWQFTQSPLGVFNCAGGVTITNQIGTSFTGTFFLRDSGCGDLSGSVTDGTIDTSGAVSFGLATPGTGANFPVSAFGCTYVSGDRVMTGTLIGNQLDVQARTEMDCGASGPATLVLRLSGTR